MNVKQIMMFAMMFFAVALSSHAMEQGQGYSANGSSEMSEEEEQYELSKIVGTIGKGYGYREAYGFVENRFDKMSSSNQRYCNMFELVLLALLHDDFYCPKVIYLINDRVAKKSVNKWLIAFISKNINQKNDHVSGLLRSKYLQLIEHSNVEPCEILVTSDAILKLGHNPNNFWYAVIKALICRATDNEDIRSLIRHKLSSARIIKIMEQSELDKHYYDSLMELLSACDE